MIKTAALLFSIVFLFNSPLVKREAPDFLQMSVEARASELGLETSEFILFSSVVEAESNRCPIETEEDLEGRIYIAVCILNRVSDDRFPDTITEVLTQRGQFSTVRNGHSVTNRTDASDLAVIRAVEWMEEEDYPEDILFFNCVGYSYGEPYGYIGGNYFMTLD